MKKKKNHENYTEFDYLEILVKRGRVDQVIQNYGIFGWQIEQKDDNERYEDLVDLTFSRPHKIRNKDELQLNQVFMEENLNQYAKLEKHKHSKSISLGLGPGLIGFSAIVLAVLGFASVLPFALWLSITLAAVGGIATALVFGFLPSIVKKEKISYNNKSKLLQEELQRILHKAQKLTGGQDE